VAHTACHGAECRASGELSLDGLGEVEGIYGHLTVQCVSMVTEGSGASGDSWASPVEVVSDLQRPQTEK
jgi:hypothetical protein